MSHEYLINICKKNFIKKINNYQDKDHMVTQFRPNQIQGTCLETKIQLQIFFILSQKNYTFIFELQKGHQRYNLL
jgi:hypothetical protein